MTFDIYPAIDLRQGRVVRLQLGDPDRQTVFSDDPLETARRWRDAGAGWLHVVNLDGAFDQDGAANWRALETLTTLGMRVQFGGGLREPADLSRAFEAGITRAVLGTAAVEQPEMVLAAIDQYGSDRVAVAVDARDGMVRTRGWQTTTAVSAEVLAQSLQSLGVRLAVFTDIGRDGVLKGANLEATMALAESSGLAVIASGGVRSLDDVRQLRARAVDGVIGVIIGRALYEGQVDLAAALAVANEGV